MLAAVLRDFNDLILDEVPMPEPDWGQAVVRIKSCGVCATDYKAIKGIRRNVEFPFTPGHEPAGIVTALGRGVKHVREGDEVVVMPANYCGACEHCRLGQAHYCEHGVTTGGDGLAEVWPGAFAEYMKIDARSLFQKPKNISFDAAALAEPLSGAWKGVIKYSQLQIGDDTVIIGVGGIGLLCLMVAKAAGAGRLIAIDPSAYARDNATRLGATHVIDPNAEDPFERVYEILPKGPDLVLEAAGYIDAVKLMFKLRRRGTRVNLFGITTHEIFELDGGTTHFMETRMDSSFGTNPESISQAIRLMERGLVDPEQIITHRFPLTKLQDAVQTMSTRERNKVMINP